IGEEATPEELHEALNKKFAASTTQAYYDQLKEMKLEVLTPTALVKYTADFQEIVDRHPDFGDDEHVAAMFLRGLKIPRLSERTRSEVDTAGKKSDLEFVIQQTFTELEEMVAIKDEVLKYSKSFGLSVRQFKPSWTGGKRRRAEEPLDRKPIRCHRCGKLGHKAANCRSLPDKPSQSTKTTSNEKRHSFTKSTGNKNFSLNIMSRELWEMLDPKGKIEKEITDIILELADGSTRKVSERVRILVKMVGAMDKQIEFWADFILLDIKSEARHKVIIGSETASNVGLIDLTLPIKTDKYIPEDWEECDFDSWDKGNLECDKPELDDEIGPILRHYEERDSLNRAASVEPMKIILKPESNPVAQPPRNLPYKKEKYVTEEIQDLLEKGYITPSCSPWSSPVVVVGKKDGGFRLCSGYHQMPLAEESRQITAFVTRDGLFEFTRIVGGGAVLEQEEMSDRRGRRRVSGNAYQQIWEKDFAVKVESVEINRYSQDKERYKKNNGALNYMREFIDHYSEVTEPISRLLSGPEHNIQWGQEQESAWEETLDLLEKNITLVHFDDEAEIFVRTDASTIGAGGMLGMMKDGKEYPIAFYSHKFTETQKHWCTLEQEAFALFWVLTKARKYLWGRSFTVETDHRNLTFMLKCESAKVQRWRMSVADFNFVIKHIPGKLNKVADTLSRGFHKTSITPSSCKLSSPIQSDNHQLNILLKIKDAQESSLSDTEKKNLFLLDEFWVTAEDKIFIPAKETKLQDDLAKMAHRHPLG
ncbi:hypothetical protein ADUPG1_000994, partial [Aduncisulcus paluster]